MKPIQIHPTPLPLSTKRQLPRNALNPSACCPPEDLPNMARSRQVRRRMLDLRRLSAVAARRPWRAPSARQRIAARSLRLRSGDQIGKAAPVVLAKDEPNADELGNRRTIPLRLPTRLLPARRRAPIGEVEPLDIADQLGLAGLRGRGGGQLVAMRRPIQDEPSAVELERDIGSLSGSESGRQVADKGEACGGAL